MMLVWMNSPGPSIERSTWLSAARCMTASTPSSCITFCIASRSQMSSLWKLYFGLDATDAVEPGLAA